MFALTRVARYTYFEFLSPSVIDPPHCLPRQWYHRYHKYVNQNYSKLNV